MSKIIKSNFISFSEQKREIQVIPKDNPHIIQSSISGSSDPLEEESVADALVGDGEFREQDYFDYEQETGLNPPEETGSKSGYERISEREIYEEAKKVGYEDGYEAGIQAGKQAGYDDGKAQGYQESQGEIQEKIEQEKQHLRQENQEYKDKLELEYNTYKEQIEPQVLRLVEDLVEKLVGVNGVSQDTILHLIKLGLNEIELHGDLTIKVSSEDLDYVLIHKHLITEEMSQKMTVEILKDQQLEKNQCVIETEMGTIDCSLGTQLQGLLRELRLIHDSLEK